MFDLRQLRQFVAVAEELNFRRAADRLHMAQPPLSQAIRRLEENLGAPLFHRSQRRVTLTRTGEVLLDEAHALLDLADRAMAHVRDVAQGRMGRIEVGFVLSASYVLLPPILRRFRAEHPAVELGLHELNTAAQIEALKRRRLDVGLVRLPLIGGDGLSHEIIHHERLVAVLPENHPAVGKPLISIRDLEGWPFIMFPSDWHPGYNARILNACQEAGFTPQVIQESVQPQVMVGLVAAGMGVALGPHSLMSLNLGGVVYKEIADPSGGLSLELALAWRSNVASRATAAFRDVARAVGAERNAA